MYEKSISKKTKAVLKKISTIKDIKNFYLAGGTGLAIQLGHRLSIDLDFFTPDKFNVQNLKHELASKGDYKIDTELDDTLDGTLDQVRVSFFYNSHEPNFSFKKYRKIKLADERDIAAMKLNAISGRGSKKDFVDIYFLLKKYSVDEIINFFETMYSDAEYNKTHLIKSLTYFKDAENDPLPEMFEKINWSDVKMEIEKEAKKLL